MFANNNFLILALVDVSNEFGSFRLFVRQSVRSQCKVSELAHQIFFFFFCMKVETHKAGKVTDPDF